MRRGLLARIDLKAARKNLELISEAANGCSVIAVVKADAYGHGAVELSQTFLNAGASMLAVAFVSEARRLREAEINAPLLVLFDRSDIPEFFDLNLTPVIHDMKTAKEFSKEALNRNTEIKVHVKVDTGMGRMGLEDPADIQKILALDGLNVAGLMSHLSDADLIDTLCSNEQIGRFRDICKTIDLKNVTCHMANSAAVFSCPEAHLDAVRPGLALYGISPFEDVRDVINKLSPVMSVSAEILSIRKIPKGGTVSYGRTFKAERDTLTAVLAAGYADGLCRALSNKTNVIINGQKAPIAGRVCMDLTMADITDIPGVKEGDHAILLGADGNEQISAWELAGLADTIPYEVLTSFGNKAQRVFE